MNFDIYEFPKCLLTWENAQCNAIAKAFNVMQCIGPSAPMISDFGLLWANETDITEANIKIFMGTSVKFVSLINGSFPPQKIMGQFFFSEKRENQGGGTWFFCQKGTILPFFWHPSLIDNKYF